VPEPRLIKRFVSGWSLSGGDQTAARLNYADRSQAVTTGASRGLLGARGIGPSATYNPACRHYRVRAPRSAGDRYPRTRCLYTVPGSLGDRRDGLLPNRTPQPPLAIARYGSLDVPLTVWTVKDAADLVDGLLAELASTGRIIAVDLSGWQAIPRAGRRTHVYYRRRATTARALAGLTEAEQRRTTIEAACESTLAVKLREHQAGMIVASAWLLRCPGALEATIDALKPGGVLVLAGRSEQDAVDIATLTDVTFLPLSFTAYLVAATPAVFDTASDTAPESATGAAVTVPASHWGIGVWRRTSEDGGAHG
jgi:hypothetical protein